MDVSKKKLEKIIELLIQNECCRQMIEGSCVHLYDGVKCEKCWEDWIERRINETE